VSLGRRIPPVLAAPTTGALAAGLAAALTGARAGELEREVGLLFPGSWVRDYCSGRAALRDALIIAMRATGRRRVVVPAFTSYSVAAAAAAASAEVVLGDVMPETLDYDPVALRRCVDEPAAAVVLGNLYGFPSLTRELGWLKDHGVLVIDDAAQALGASSDGRAVGGRGDIGVLSFGRGKCVTTGQGGALLVPDASLARTAESVVGSRSRKSAGIGPWLAAAAVAASRSQLLFGWLTRLPGVDIGESRYDSGIGTGPASRAADGLSVGLGGAMARHLETRRQVADAWRRAIGRDGPFATIAPKEGSDPAYLRFPLLARDADTRRALIGRLARTGMRYVHSFPEPLSRLAAFQASCVDGPPVPGAQRLAGTVIALPCHAGVGPGELRAAAAALRSLDEGMSVAAHDGYTDSKGRS